MPAPRMCRFPAALNSWISPHIYFLTFYIKFLHWYRYMIGTLTTSMFIAYSSSLSSLLNFALFKCFLPQELYNLDWFFISSLLIVWITKTTNFFIRECVIFHLQFFRLSKFFPLHVSITMYKQHQLIGEKFIANYQCSKYLDITIKFKILFLNEIFSTKWLL